MKVYKQLVNTFLRSEDMDAPKQKKQKLFYALMGIISIVFIMIPCCALVGYLSYAFALALFGNSAGTLFVIHFISLFSVVFGINVILNVFYFAGDIEFILPLPIQPYKVIAAKFTTAYFAESVMQFIILLSAMVGYFIAAGGNILTVLYALVGVVTLPVAPLAYCGIICVVLMGLTKWIRNKEHVRKLSMIFTLIVIAAGVSCINLLKDVDMEGVANALMEGRVAFVNVMSVVFPTNALLVKSVETGSILQFLLYILINVAVVGLFLVLAQFLYYRGVLGMSSAGGASKSGRKKRRIKARKPEVSYFFKECKVLFRTPAFFLNCIVINVLWPVLLYVIYAMQSDGGIIEHYIVMYHMGNETMKWGAVLIVLAVSVLLTAANSIASSAITREGKQYYVMKYLPVNYKKQLHIKAFLSILVSGAFVWLYIIVCSVVLDVSNATCWYYMLISILQVVFITYFGIYLDTINPKLAWDDELNALRGNTNVFFNMAYAMMISIAFAVVMLLLFMFTKLTLIILENALVLVLVAANVIMIRIVERKGVENLKEL